MEQVALMGLGIMGAGMGKNLLKAGFPLTVYNRTRERALPLEALGARVADSPREAAKGAQVIISMVADDEASRAVWQYEHGALAGAAPGAVLIECGTLSPPWVRELAAEARERGCGCLDAPVTGSKEQAETGKVLFLVGGEKEHLEKARAILSAMSRGIEHLGPSGSGVTMKLINNLTCGVQIATMAEVVALIERTSMDREKVLNLLYAGAPGSPIVKTIGPRMAARNYDLNFVLKLMEKDLRYALALAGQHGADLKTVAAAHQLFQTAAQSGLGGKDMSAVVELLRSGNRHRMTEPA
ncbi:MAG TPA: NAD(P)-dependent oxidoreductase [Terriglobia bacterium]|nr:NAD(P)-dependent oxidoreductase [Terriglobia bacterium]